MSNLASQTSLLSIGTNIVEGGTSSLFSTDSMLNNGMLGDTLNDTESFLNTLLNSIDATNEFLPNDVRVSETKIVNQTITQNLYVEDFSQDDKISIFESASFTQILSLLDTLQTNTANISLANLSSQLSDLVQTESTLNALKEATNLTELLSIAKDMGLNVEKIKVDRLGDLKTAYPNLAKANFFQNDNVDNVFKELVTEKITTLTKNLEDLMKEKGTSLNQNLHIKNNKNHSSLLTKTLQNLDEIIADEGQNLKNKNINNENNIDLDIDLNLKTKEDSKNQNLQNQNIKEVSTKDLKQDSKIENTLNLKSENVNKGENLKNENLKNENVKNENVKNDNNIKENVKESKTNNELKTQNKPTQTNENVQKTSENLRQNDNVKNENIKQETEIKTQNLNTSKPNTENKQEAKAEVKPNEMAKTQEKEVKNEVTPELKSENKQEVKQEIKAEIKPENKTEIKNEVKQEIKPNIQATQTKEESTFKTEDKQSTTQNKEVSEPKAQTKQSSEIKQDNASILRQSQVLSQNAKEVNLSPKQDINLSSQASQAIFTQQSAQGLDSTQTILSKDNASNFTNVNDMVKDTKTNVNLNQENNVLFNEQDSSFDELNSLVKDLSRINHNQVRAQATTPKQTMQYFSQDLQEAISQYKSPITKLSITLNPSNLGEVEVVLMQRGNNLHINFNSNSNTMQLFLQHQAEFKNSLVNMGFTGLEMNFSDQSKKDQRGAKTQSTRGFSDMIDGNDDNINLEVVLAKYF
ncbi:flagellar hook-length control protein FliK [Campylobacter sp. LR291e]|uniref:flagellar hook-length control protein FliK n=1 Tax=unclassified Campylobacter TaxID=2593542 RepID=UPI001237CC35|nr:MULTISPECIES: flagellar hook-length control protein FliK [unclassified Campylobacter]KAA6226217.1 flagellar hook-length control protein FliK [Campylobacter sp. LR185c]KAA6231418.1 flagellar hook-length control protein FliK [Campylobacter sp. LR264d]KAA6231630.1 flagellar hook-length control protein FliK [Campylobacter sp. LR291e]KAA8604715.1 flagellar hook-length control protein [Campylobacter sp. LR185c]